MNTKFPKEGIKKLKETIKKLKDDVKSLEAENRQLKYELQNLVKPVRSRKGHVDREKLSSEEWRKDFLKRVKEDLKKK